MNSKFRKKGKIYLINHVSAESLTTGLMIPMGTNSPPPDVSIQ
jgi:hypothetical protein